jgi:hypothetical protein
MTLPLLRHWTVTLLTSADHGPESRCPGVGGIRTIGFGHGIGYSWGVADPRIRSGGSTAAA